jgi:uncharacterized HhH-GPD family protein
MKGTLAVTGDPEANELLNTDPLALVIGMLLDQQVPMEWAFMGPYRLRERLGGLDAAAIAATDPEAVAAAFSAKPALHRFPASMAQRTQALAAHVVDHYDGDAARIWEGVPSAAEVMANLRALPGFGEEKSKIFMALLAKRFGVTPAGWEEATAPFSDDHARSVADIDGPESLERVRTYKKDLKATGRDKQGRPTA